MNSAFLPSRQTRWCFPRLNNSQDVPYFVPQHPLVSQEGKRYLCYFGHDSYWAEQGGRWNHPGVRSSCPGNTKVGHELNFIQSNWRAQLELVEKCTLGHPDKRTWVHSFMKTHDEDRKRRQNVHRFLREAKVKCKSAKWAYLLAAIGAEATAVVFHFDFDMVSGSLLTSPEALHTKCPFKWHTQHGSGHTDNTSSTTTQIVMDSFFLWSIYDYPSII